jgi:glycosyl transferase, family 25
MQIKTFVINLKRSADRKVHMTNQLDNLHISYEIFDAVDGLELSDHEIESKYGIDTFPTWASYNARNLTKGEIGCILSHLRIYKRMVDEDIECACIFEDDNDFKKDIANLLKDNHLHKVDWGLLFLGHAGMRRNDLLGAECSSRQVHVFSDYHISKPVEAPFNTSAYLIKKTAAIKLLHHAYPLRMPMDFITGHAEAVGIEVYVLTPPCTTQNKLLFQSTIQDDTITFINLFRNLKKNLGEKFPILRILKRLCTMIYIIPILKIRKIFLSNISYADKRYFYKKG